MKTLHKFLGIALLAVCLAFAFVGCTPTNDNPPDHKIDNTDSSKNHDKVYLYADNNVPYDSDNNCYAYCFITPYLAPFPTGGAVVVFPGGGYNHLSNATNKGGADNDGDQKEASAIAAKYNAAGISVFVVNYRTTAVDDEVCYKQILADGTRAVKLVRANAERWYVNPDKIAVQGYSAGGHLASVLLTKGGFVVDDPDYTADDTDKLSATPNAGVLCYAVTSFADDITHKGTRRVFTANDETLYATYSSADNVTKSTPPTYLWCHEHDGTVSSQNTYLFASALDDCGVQYQLDVFDDNGTTAHGVGIAADYPEAKAWTDNATAFLQGLGF